MREIYASYSPSKFAMDVTNIPFAETDGITHIPPEAMPAFVHEYCHYLQDITTISAIFGFYLWMHDVVGLTTVFAQGEGEVKTIPLASGPLGLPNGEMRKFYRIYCGTGRLEFPVPPAESSAINRIEFSIEQIPLQSGVREIARNTLVFGSALIPDYHFGLMPLQEIQCFYAQRFRENSMTGVVFEVPTADMMAFPYHLGDILFHHHNIEADNIAKFFIATLTLDSIQAPTVFLRTLEALANRPLRWNKDEGLIRATVARIDRAHAHDKQAFFQEIVGDIRRWSQDNTRVYLSEALKWYLKTVEVANQLKNGNSTFFFHTLLMPLKDVSMMAATFPPPILLRNGEFNRYSDVNNSAEDQRYESAFQAAGTIWNHWMLYDLLTTKTSKEINDKCCCPMFDGCTYKAKIGHQYTCKTAPWEIIKESHEIICPYGMAAHSFGLWQNTLEILPDEG